MTRNDLVVLSLERWDDVWRRNQYLIAGLLSSDPSLRVLFVEPSHDVLHSVVHGRRLGRGAGLRPIDGYDNRLWHLEPTKVLPRVLGGLADALLRQSVLRAMRKLHIDAPVLWVNDPTWAGLVQAHPRWPALYDVTDDWTAAERSARELDRLRSNETVLLERAQAVVVCSAALAASKGADRPVVHVSNAVEVARYRRPAARPDDLPPGPTALYVGTLHEDRLDVELAGRTARRLAASGATLVLVGPNRLTPEHASYLTQEGAVILGGRAFDEVPAYLQHAGALVVPHLVNPFTDSLDPIKLYEYLAVGRPVVSTPVAGFRDLTGPGIHSVASAEFAEAVARVVDENRPSVLHVDVPDWSSRVDAMAQVLSPLRAIS